MIKAVFFDAGNTLIYPHPGVAEVCAEIFLKHGYDYPFELVRDAVVSAESYYEERYWTDDTFWASETGAADFWIGYYSFIAKHLGIENGVRHVARAVYDAFGEGGRWCLYPDAPPAIEDLKKRGMILGVVSNWDTRLSEILFDHGLHDAFNFIISSACVGRIKPQPEIFETALARAGVEPHEALHVGDHFYADVLGASTAGIKPVLVDRNSWGPFAGYASVKDLSELLYII